MVISFHSLEDRIVKTFIVRESNDGVRPACAVAPPRRHRLKALGGCARGRRSRCQPARPLGDHAGGRAHRGRGMTGSTRLLIALLASCIYLVQVSYDGRRLFTDHRSGAQRAARARDRARALKTSCRTEATPSRVERTARDRLAMRTATPA